jgi:segregation and condensation protein A
MTSGLEIFHLRLADFEGPLSLLLHLIEKNELEVTRVSVAAVADQFVDLVARQGATDLATTGEFVAAAARLLLIKSRALLYRRDLGLDDCSEQDDAEALARQLAEYARFKHAGSALGMYLAGPLLTRPRTATIRSGQARQSQPSIEVQRLQRAGIRLLRHPQTEAQAADPWPDIRYGDLRAVLLDEVRRLRQTTFSELSATAWHPLVVITMFLALLDAVRARQLSIWQSEAFGPISVALPKTSTVHA